MFHSPLKFSNMAKLRLKTGDMVVVLSGKDRGKKGKISQVFPAQNRVVVEGVNTMIKNVKSRQQADKGQKIEYNGPIHASNVMLIDPKSNQPTRLGSARVGDKRVRKSIRSQQPLS